MRRLFVALQRSLGTVLLALNIASPLYEAHNSSGAAYRSNYTDKSSKAMERFQQCLEIYSGGSSRSISSIWKARISRHDVIINVYLISIGISYISAIAMRAFAVKYSIWIGLFQRISDFLHQALESRLPEVSTLPQLRQHGVDVKDISSCLL